METQQQGIEYKKHASKKTVISIKFDGKGQSGTLTEWKVEKGEKVKANTVLGLVETSTTTYAVRTNQKGGVIQKLLFKEGDKIKDG